MNNICKNKGQQNEKFSGWSVVFGCFLLQFLGTGMVTGTVALFMAPITTEFGFDTGSYSMIFLVSSLTAAAGAMWFGPRLQKGNARRILMISTMIAGILYFLLGLCTQLWHFIAVWGVLSFVFAGVSHVAVAIIITPWFEYKRSIAMSIGFSGVGLGTSVWSLIWGRIIADYRWEYAYFIGGIIVAVVTTLVIFIFIKKNPESYNQSPLRAKTSRLEDGEQLAEVWEGVERKVAIKTLPFAMIVISVLGVGWLAAGVATHAVNYLIGIGWSTTASANIQSLFGVVSIFAIILGGILFDKLGFRNGTVISLGFAMVGLISLMLSSNHIFGYLYAISYGLSLSLPRLMPAMFVSEVFGKKDYGSIYSLVNFVFLMGCAIGSVLTGVINDNFGYKTVWTILIIISVITSISVIIAIKNSKRLREEYPNVKIPCSNSEN